MKLVLQHAQHHGRARQAQEYRRRNQGHYPGHRACDQVCARVRRLFLEQRGIGRQVIHDQVWTLHDGGEEGMDHGGDGLGGGSAVDQ
jgi:hypothetical protein